MDFKDLILDAKQIKSLNENKKKHFMNELKLIWNTISIENVNKDQNNMLLSLDSQLKPPLLSKAQKDIEYNNDTQIISLSGFQPDYNTNSSYDCELIYQK